MSGDQLPGIAQIVVTISGLDGGLSISPLLLDTSLGLSVTPAAASLRQARSSMGPGGPKSGERS
jgi:hypothetical protein